MKNKCPQCGNEVPFTGDHYVKCPGCDTALLRSKPLFGTGDGSWVRDRDRFVLDQVTASSDRVHAPIKQVRTGRKCQLRVIGGRAELYASDVKVDEYDSIEQMRREGWSIDWERISRRMNNHANSD